MKKLLLFSITALVALSVPAAPASLKKIPQEARWMVHADLEAFQASELGKAFKERIVDTRLQNKLAAFRQMFHFDPTKDLKAVTLYGPSSRNTDAVAVLQGKFDTNALVTLLKANDTHAVRQENGAEIHSWVEKRKGEEQRTYAALPDASTLIIGGNGGQVARAVSVHQGVIPGMNPEQAPIDLPEDPETLFTATANLDDLGLEDARASIMRNIVSVNVNVGEQGGQVKGTLRLTARTPEMAGQIQSVLAGFLAMLQLKAAEHPDMALVAKSIRSSLDGDVLSISASVPVKEFISGLEKHEASIRAQSGI